MRWGLIFSCVSAICALSCTGSTPLKAHPALVVVLLDGNKDLRQQSLQVSQTLAKQPVRVLFYDLAYVNPSESADSFAQQLNDPRPVVSDFYMHQKEVPGASSKPDWKDWVPSRIHGIPHGEASGFWGFNVVELPYPAMIQQSEAVVFPFLTPNAKGIADFQGLYAWCQGILVEQASVTLAKLWLNGQGESLRLSADLLRLERMQLKDSSKTQTLIKRRGTAQPLGFKIGYAPIPSLTLDQLQGAKIPHDALVLVGVGGPMDQKMTSMGSMDGVMLLANQVNTLLMLPAE